MEEPTASDTASLHLASFYSYTKSKERARGLAERVLRSQPDNLQALSRLGWIILQQHQDEEYAALADEGELDEAMGHFEAVLEQDSNELEVGAGGVRVHGV